MIALAGMAERRVPEVVAERDGFGELLVQAQHLGDRARDLRHLERVREPRAVVIAGRREEDLRLVLEPPEGLAVDDAIAIALERRPDVVFAFRPQAAARVGALRRLRREDLALARLELLAERVARVISPQKARAVGERGTPNSRPRASGRGRRTSAACRGPRRRARAAPATSSGTYSREWSVLGVVGSLPWSAVTTSRSSSRRRGRSAASRAIEPLEVRA